MVMVCVVVGFLPVFKLSRKSGQNLIDALHLLHKIIYKKTLNVSFLKVMLKQKH